MPEPTYDEALKNLKGSITSFREFLSKPIEYGGLMAIDPSNMKLSAAAPIDPEEELAEAHAHGFETVKEFYDWMTEKYNQHDEDQQ